MNARPGPGTGPEATPHQRVISLPATGRVLEAIERHADTQGVPLGRAASALIEAALNAAPPPTLVNLEAVSTDDIIDELVGRLAQVRDLDEMTARAEAAEAKLLTIAAALAPAA